MYIVIEIQKSNDGTVAPILTTHPTRDEAEQKYHTVLAYAAVSEVNVHSATMLDDTGALIRNETYYHGSTEE